MIFKTGDRVRVYGTSQLGNIKNLDGELGVIANICIEGTLKAGRLANVLLDGDAITNTFHIKQLSRVRTEPRNIVYINNYGSLEHGSSTSHWIHKSLKSARDGRMKTPGSSTHKFIEIEVDND